MIKPVAGSGNRNKTEALYLLKGNEPRHRKKSDAGSSEAWERENYPPAETGNSRWDSSMRRVQERDQRRGTETEDMFGSSVTEEEVVAFLGSSPRNDDLPNWIREAIVTEDGGLGAKGRCWPILIRKVRVGPEFQRHPWLYGAIYGLLRYHSLTRDANDNPQTWVSVARRAVRLRSSFSCPRFSLVRVGNGSILQKIAAFGKHRFQARAVMPAVTGSCFAVGGAPVAITVVRIGHRLILSANGQFRSLKRTMQRQ